MRKLAALSLGIWLALSGATQVTRAQAASQGQGGPAKSHGQTKAATAIASATSPEQTGQPSPARIVDLLRAVADNAKAWADTSAAARMQAQVADLTWEVDAVTAQQYLTQAWATAGRVKEAQPDKSRFRNSSLRTDARREVLLVARRRAPEVAKKWLEQMAQEAEAEQNGQTRGVFDDRTPRSAVLLQLALTSVADSPQAAAELLTESLRDGISFGFQHVLIALQEKNVELAQTVFRAALNRLKTAGMLAPDELMILYAYLYTPGRVFGANTTENRGSTQIAVGRDQPRITAAAELNPALALEFLQLAADLLVNAPLPSTTLNPQVTARTQISVIGFLLIRMTAQPPEQSLALQRRVQQIEADAKFSSAPIAPVHDMPTVQAGESQKEYAERRVDSLEERAGKESDPLSRDIAYAQAALATTVERYERGWRLAQKISERSFRDAVANWLTYRATLAAVKAGDLDTAYELNKKNSEPAQRAASLVVGAQQLVITKDRIRAAQWLQEAQSLIKAAGADEDWTRIAFGVVSTYGRFDSLLALQALSAAIKLMNQTPTAHSTDERAPLVKRFSGLTLQDFNYGTTGFGLASAVGSFQPEQFEDVLGRLNDLTSAEARGIAVVTLCRSYLQGARNARATPTAPL